MRELSWSNRQFYNFLPWLSILDRFWVFKTNKVVTSQIIWSFNLTWVFCRASKNIFVFSFMIHWHLLLLILGHKWWVFYSWYNWDHKLKGCRLVEMKDSVKFFWSQYLQSRFFNTWGAKTRPSGPDNCSTIGRCSIRPWNVDIF